MWTQGRILLHPRQHAQWNGIRLSELSCDGKTKLIRNRWMTQEFSLYAATPGIHSAKDATTDVSLFAPTKSSFTTVNYLPVCRMVLTLTAVQGFLENIFRYPSVTLHSLAYLFFVWFFFSQIAMTHIRTLLDDSSVFGETLPCSKL